MDDPLPNPQPPEDVSGLRVTAPAAAAGGLGAIVSTARIALPQMGVRRTLATLRSMNQKDGFDCPSCAWPDPDGERSAAEFCENGAKAVASEATTARATPEFFARHSVADLAAHDDAWLDRQGRLVEPMLLREGARHYEPIAWDEAFLLIARELNALASPDEALFYTSGRTSNEAAFLFQLFARQFGTNNLPDCSNMCHESSGVALTQTIGIGKGTVTLEDFDAADAIFVIGQNPGTNHPRMLTTLQRAAQRGCRIVSINPLAEPGLIRFRHPQDVLGMLGRGTPIASLHVPVRINGDVAVLKGIMKHMLEEDERTGGKVLARDFIRERTAGFETFAEDVRHTAWSEIVEQSGVERDVIRQAAEVAMAAERMIVCWAMGLTQHRNAIANIQSIVNFTLLRGQIGRRGAGLCPVRGHSNVQGDRTVGITTRPSAKLLDALRREFCFDPPTAPGLDVVRAIEAMRDRRAKVLFALGGNFLSASPDTEATAAALRGCRLTVQVSTKLNRSHLVTGRTALILPCLGRTERDAAPGGGEQFVSVEDSMGVVHASRGVLAPASPKLLSEVAIVARLARATLGSRSAVQWGQLAGDYDAVRGAIERVVAGFDGYNRRIREPGGFYLPNGPREGRFDTPDGKAHFTVHPIPRHELADDELLLMTLRSHDQFNTTVYGHDDRYRGVYGNRRVIFMNRADISRLGLREGQVVDLSSGNNGAERIARRFVVVPYAIPPRCAAAYFPEANVLVPLASTAKGSNQPASKSIPIRVVRCEPHSLEATG